MRDSLGSLPIFPQLMKKPRNPDPTCVVAYIAYQEHLAGEAIPFAHLGLQRLLRRSSGGRGTKLLPKLVPEFLERNEDVPEDDAYEYWLSTKLSPDERALWVELGRILYGDKGCLVGDFLTRGSIKSGYIKLTGFLVLGSLAYAGVPVPRLELVRALAPLVSRNTVINRCKQLASRDVGLLVPPVDEVVSLPPDWLDRLGNYEERWGLVELAEVHDKTLLETREFYALVRAGGPAYARRWRAVRAGRCDVCGVPAEEADHFPAKFQGGWNHSLFLRPVCRQHNLEREKLAMAGGKLPRLRLVGRYRAEGFEEGPSAHAEWAMERAYDAFREAERTGDADLFERSKDLSARAIAVLMYAEWLDPTVRTKGIFKNLSVVERIAFVLNSPATMLTKLPATPRY